ncbi:enoyl-CoA hydratase/isomerase family protein [Nocardia harenae]|uniref:enoyl-CoA hydratase/isomerase family protein n=1 Tax=Nocardia harenae TaxID=358707 RepID=UPI000835EA43|nr:enoyl-CoA hydratase-related protein [Nocardia harenae]
MSDPLVLLEVADGVATVRFDHPPVNALSGEVLTALTAVVDRLEADEAIRAAVLTGTGTKAFVAGADISEFAEMIERGTMPARAASSRLLFDRIEALPIPVLAAVQASAVGGGLELALLCDVVIASERAKFGLTETKLGLIPGGGGTQRLSRKIGIGAAKYLLLSGRVIPAAEALRLGLIEQTAPPEQVLETALALARELAALPAVAVQAAKAAIDLGTRLPLADGLDLEREVFLETFDSDDFRLGFAAFLNKQPATFNSVAYRRPR